MFLTENECKTSMRCLFYFHVTYAVERLINVSAELILESLAKFECLENFSALPLPYL